MDTPLTCTADNCDSTWWLHRLEIQVTPVAAANARGHMPIPLAQRTTLVCANCGAPPAEPAPGPAVA